MRKVLIVGLFVNAALLAGNWYEDSAVAESGGVRPGHGQLAFGRLCSRTTDAISQQCFLDPMLV